MTTFTETELRALMAKAVREVRATNPLAPSITNTVTQSFVANAQLAVGGSAAMVYLPDEGEAVAQASGATYINLGTLLPIYEETIPRTAQALAAAGKPWVLDPVGIGIGSLRSQLLRQVQPCKPALVRANASEVIALASLWGLDVDRTAACNDAQPGAADAATDESQTPGSTAAGDTNDKPVSAEAAADAPSAGPRGVDATDSVDAAEAAAAAIARFTGGAVAVSGPIDLVTDGTTAVRLTGGSPLMERITGAGCSLGGVAAVFCCVANPFVAALAATAAYNVAGTRAAARSDAPGSFQVAFLDELYHLTPEDVADAPLKLEAR
ncbi:hydroxyethylthiazole kinase [uncultured Adlercreutzia sp.]|uniref:hydroxyethylthiazole kinase n=1 Tax=uncultured Adlercreutzia sp. TaxID=875803 RepID=UPI0025FBC148|nr:hydroxyethylthiazole kinase [uncultured Adlercreutzia sp.]